MQDLAVELIAHRGASTEAPENSIDAFEKAIGQGADRIELDVRLTADGQPIIIHDTDTERVCERKLIVAQTPLAALRELRLQNGEPLPTLDEVLDLIEGRIPLSIEIKSKEPNLPDLLLERLRARGLARETFFCSFDVPTLQRLGDLGFDGRHGLLIGSRSRSPRKRLYEAWPMRALKRSGATELVIHHLLAHPPLRKYLAMRGYGLTLWFAMEDETKDAEERARLYRRAAAKRPRGLVLGRVAEARGVLASPCGRSHMPGA
jgi:glycerophosphoryl diester phosphodiesterase